MEGLATAFDQQVSYSRETADGTNLRFGSYNRQPGMYGPPPFLQAKNESDVLVCANVFGLCWRSDLLA